MVRRDRSRAGNLSGELTSFVGRRHDIAEAKRLLSAARLVTLTGAGGVGKTRLALRVAQQVHRAFPGGVWLLELDRLRDESLLPQTVADALGLREQPGLPAVEALIGYLPGRHVLLLLDNCEHLLNAVAKLTDRLLQTAADLRVLATSREPLGIAGENILDVPPLHTPDPRHPVDRTELLRSDAVALFTERAAAMAPGFTVTDANQAAVAQICHLLDGLPLAIELTVPRLRVLAAEQLRDRLHDRLALATRGSRAGPARQQTLRRCIDWSYELCTQTERGLWASLSVFAGGFDLDAVEQVCDGTQLAPDYLIDVLASLIDKSILIREDHDGTIRYRMLETLREYGAHRQAERREHDKIARRHRDYYATMAAHAEAAWTGPEQLRWARTLTREHANIQAAMEYCLREPAEVAAAQELAAHLWFFWIACGLLREGRYYLDRALDRGGEGRPRRWALWACAFAAGSQGDLDTAEDLARQCHTDANAAGDAQLATYATEAQAMTLAVRGDLDRAVELMHECLTYYRNLDPIDAGLLRTQPMLGVTLVMRGDLDAALALAPHSQQLCERLGERWQRSYVDYFVGMALRGKNQATRAVEHLAAAIETKHQFHDIVGIVMCLEPLAGAHADLHDAARAARLLGAAEQLRHSFGLSTLAAPFHTSEYQRAEQQARHLLGTQQYERAFHHGQSMNLDQIVACAVTGSQGPQLTAPTSNGPDPLTRRETQAAELVSQGLSNRDIAARLVISTRTAESHVHNIMTKLGFTNRAQLAAWVTAYRHDHTPPTG